ncbi:MAG: hypothetical protein HYR84_15735 [Planctomycetes bacterium]|nr:hypothetical protein [Planctomycetota bacterium]
MFALFASLAEIPALQATALDQPQGKLPSDPAVNAFFDAKQFGDAPANSSASRIGDCALLPRQGEEVLLRERAGISSTRLFSLALTVAAQKGDHATLKRLARNDDT